MKIHDDVGSHTVRQAGLVEAGEAESLVHELVDEFNSVSDPAELARRVLLRAVVETRSDRGVISWVEGDEMVVASCHDAFGQLVLPGSRWPLAGEQVSWVALAGLPQVDGLTHGDGSGAARGEGFSAPKHVLVTPVTVADEDVAIICVSRRRPEQFTALDTEILDLVALAGAQPLRAARARELLCAARAELAEHTARTDSVERVKTDILRLASHELRSPLTVLNGYLSLVSSGFFGDIPEPLNGVLALLERRTADMNALVNDMLVAARIEDIPADAAAAELVDLRFLLRDAADAVEPRASPLHRLTVHLPDRPVVARVDSERAELAVRNIIDNAVKYSPGGGDVVCTLAHDGVEACIRVSDEGLGIAAPDREKLFTRFGRVVTTTNSHIAGIGLGLYFSREVARRHGGDVRLLERDGPGCVFEMTLPLATATKILSDAAQHHE